MATVNATTTVPASPEKTFSVLTDPTRFEEWLSIHDGWTTAPPTSVAVGTTFEERVSLMGMVNKIGWTVEELTDGSSLRMTGTGMAGVKADFTLAVAPSPEGSTVSIDAEFTGAMLVGPLAAAVAKDIKQHLDGSLQTFSTLVA